MPVYNGESDISAALDSLLTQTFENFEIIISDNASTDATEKICQNYASKDFRIRYIRQKTNLGATKNFEIVLHEAVAKYFVWAACDDIRSPDFLSINLDFLENHPDFVASTSPVRFEGDIFDERRMGDSGLTGDLAQRIKAMFGTVHANGRFYSLIRRNALDECVGLKQQYLGSDWAIVLHLASLGKINRSNSGWTILGKNGLSGGRDIFRFYRRSIFDFIAPFNGLSKFTWKLAKNFNFFDKIILGFALIFMNTKGFIGQFTILLRKAN